MLELSLSSKLLLCGAIRTEHVHSCLSCRSRQCCWFVGHLGTEQRSIDVARTIGGGDVAQLVQHRTGTPQTQVRFPGAARDFSPRVNFQCRLSSGVRIPPCAIECIYISCARQISRSSCRSPVDYGNTKTPSMHRRVGSATLSQLALWQILGVPAGRVCVSFS